MTEIFFPAIQSADLLTLNFSVVAWCLCGVAIAAALVILLIALPRLRRVRQCAAPAGDEARGDEGVALPPVSVIVTTTKDGPMLERLLRAVMAQDYPTRFEVVVVDMDDDKATHDMLSRLMLEFDNIHPTFAPQSARSLSRKKLAVTLGVKAASYDSLIFTCGNCMPASNQWLRLMARHFAEGKKIVVGYSVTRPTDPDETFHARRRRGYDLCRSALKMLYPASRGYAMRADGNNMGYSRSLFLNHKGFSQHFDLIHGDDDVFISEIARPGNTAAEVSPDARVDVYSANPPADHRREVMARNFTSRFLRRGPRLAWSIVSALWWVWAACSLAGIIVALPSLIPLALLTAFNIAFCLVIGTSWRRTARALSLSPLRLTLPWLALAHPLYLFGCHLYRNGVTNYRYVWQQELSPN